MFDCVLPTRNGRNATAFTATGTVRFRNAVHTTDPGPIEAGCDCHACRLWLRDRGGSDDVWSTDASVRDSRRSDAGEPHRDSTFSRAYIRHLFLSDEMLGPILVSLHNVRFFQRLMADLRATIAASAAAERAGRGEGEDGPAWQGFRARWPVAFADRLAAEEAPAEARG